MNAQGFSVLVLAFLVAVPLGATAAQPLPDGPGGLYDTVPRLPDDLDVCDGDIVRLPHIVQVLGYNETGGPSGVAADDRYQDYGVFLFIEETIDPETEEPRWVYQIWGAAREAICEVAEGGPTGPLTDRIVQCVGALLTSDEGIVETPPDCIGIP